MFQCPMIYNLNLREFKVKYGFLCYFSAQKYHSQNYWDQKKHCRKVESMLHMHVKFQVNVQFHSHVQDILLII